MSIEMLMTQSFPRRKMDFPHRQFQFTTHGKLIEHNYNSPIVENHTSVWNWISFQFQKMFGIFHQVVVYNKIFGNNSNFFLFIVFCDPAITCNDKGICAVDGTCNCDPSFYGDNCTSKLKRLKETYLDHFKKLFFCHFFIAGCHDFM